MGIGVAPVRRGCGTRVQGGIYLECGLGKNGKPVEDFLFDPPLILPTREWGITALGVKILPEYKNVDGVPTATGVYHIYDVVGKEFYPNVADFVEEVRRFGLSRRISERADFHLLDSRSRLITLHERAYIMNADDLWPRRRPDEWWCPKPHAHHTDPAMPPPMCASLWWDTLTLGNRVGGPTNPNRQRTMPSFSYQGKAFQDDNGDGPLPLHYHLAAFAAWPVTNISVIKSKSGEHLRSHEKASKAKLHVSLEDA